MVRTKEILTEHIKGIAADIHSVLLELLAKEAPH